MKILLSLTCLLVCVYLAVGAYLYTNQRRLLYFPQPYQQDYYSSFTLTQPDATLDIITLSLNTQISDQLQSPDQPLQPTKPAIIYFGGNAEAVIQSAPMFAPLQADYDIYLVNYRGYGASTGEMTEENNYADALAIYAAIAKQHDRITLVGRSLGTGIAAYVAATKSVDKLVLITPYDSIHAVAQRKLPIYPLGLLLKDTYPSVERANQITAHTLILAAEQDRVIPLQHTKSLAKAFGNSLQYAEIKHANHANIMNDDMALTQFYNFLNITKITLKNAA